MEEKLQLQLIARHAARARSEMLLAPRPALAEQTPDALAPAFLLAGVYFEKYVKGRHGQSLWIRNLQLSIYGVPLSIAYTYLRDGRHARAPQRVSLPA